MLVILLTLFAIALAITFAGFLLSPRSQTHDPRPYVTRGAKTARNTQQAYAPRTVRARRPIVEEPPVWDASANISAWLPAFNLRQLFEPRAGQPTPWLGVLFILVALFGIGLFSMRPLFANSTVVASFWDTLPPVATNVTAPKTIEQPKPLFEGVVGASKALVRLNQMDRAQYNSAQEHSSWADSACSAAAMTVVMNAYGHKYRITDILREEIAQKQITIQQGLLYPTGIDKTVANFGFNATHLKNATMAEVIEIANKGRPIIISFPPGTWSAGGHILVLRGGSDKEVYLADSSIVNMTVMTHANFQKYWRGFAVVVTPK